MNREKQSTAGSLDGGEVADPALPVLAFARESAPGTTIARHHHLRAQLLFPLTGVMEVQTDLGAWVVPPGQAVWIPPGLSHVVRFRTRVALRSAYVHPRPAARLRSQCQVVGVSELVRALILRLMALDQPPPGEPRYLRLCEVLIDELGAMRPEPLHLPLPLDPRLAPIVSGLQSDPGDASSLADWARRVGASDRTLARAFKRETGLGFGAWRTQLRLQRAVARLAAGEAITRVALELGYGSPSAFIAMFRRTLGAPPGRYLRGPDGLARHGGVLDAAREDLTGSQIRSPP